MMSCSGCYYVGFGYGTCCPRCRHPYIDAKISDSMWQQECCFWSPNKCIGEKRMDKIKPGCGKGEKECSKPPQ